MIHTDRCGLSRGPSDCRAQAKMPLITMGGMGCGLKHPIDQEAAG